MSYQSSNRTALLLPGKQDVVPRGRAPPLNLRLTIPGTFPSPDTSVMPLPGNGGSAAQFQLSSKIRLPAERKWQLIPYLFIIPYTTPNLAPAGVLAAPGFPNGNSRVTLNIGAVANADLVLAAGLYGIADIALQLNLFAQGAGWISDAVATPIFEVSGIAATQQSIITIVPTNLLANAGGSGNVAGAFPVGGIVLNFTNPSPVTSLNDSMGAMLGFTTSTILVYNVAGGGVAAISFTSPNRADLARLSSIVIHTSLTEEAYGNGRTGSSIYSVSVGNQPPNTIIANYPSFEQAVPLTQTSIDNIQVWFTDQNGEFLPSFREDATIAFGIEEL